MSRLITLVISGIFAGFISVAALWTHIITCIQLETYVMLLCGILCPPIGMIHGIGIWFGAW